MKLEEFKALTDEEMCKTMNEYMDNHSKGNFKSQTMNFTFSQAEKAMEECGIYKIDGVYRTGTDAIQLIGKKEKERKKKQLSADDIDKIMVILEPENYKKLVKLLSSYNYVSDYILNEDRGIKIKAGRPEELHTTTVRMYNSTKVQWKEFIKDHPGFTATDLLNTALLEYMSRHASE